MRPIIFKGEEAQRYMNREAATRILTESIVFLANDNDDYNWIVKDQIQYPIMERRITLYNPKHFDCLEAENEMKKFLRQKDSIA